MVNMVIVVSGISLQKPLMHLSEYFIESCCSWSQHKSSVWQVLQLAQPLALYQPRSTCPATP